MAKMSWQYVAGFFDGEGSVGLYQTGGLGNSRFGLSIGQSERNGGYEVLCEIRDFLIEHGVTTKSIAKSCTSGRRGNPMFTLQLNKLESVRLFLAGTFPYLRVKKVVAQDILRYMKMYPSMLHIRLELKKSMGRWVHPLTERMVMEMRVLRALRGLTWVQLGKMYGVPTSTAGAAGRGQNWKSLAPFIGDNQAYQQYYPSRQFTY